VPVRPTSQSGLQPQTLAVTLGRPQAPGDPLNPPMVLSSTYRDGGPIGYAREGNAAWSALEEVVGALEGGSAVAFGSGMAAAVAVLDGLPPGCHVLAPAAPYHGVTALLRDLDAGGRLRVTTVDLDDVAAVDRALVDVATAGESAAVWAESPTNPMLDVVDLTALGRTTDRHGALLVVDNTFASPLRQHPLRLGADVVIHSATKLIGGHSDLLLGLAVTADADRAAALRRHRHGRGSVPGVLESFLTLRGIRTLAVRLDRAETTAGELARRLQRHPAVGRVRYPGLPGHRAADVVAAQMGGPGTMLAIETVGDALTADRVCAGVRLIVAATSLGGVETLIERRARNDGDRDAGVPPTLLRISVGLEDVDDLWADLDQALDRAVGRQSGPRSEPPPRA